MTDPITDAARVLAEMLAEAGLLAAPDLLQPAAELGAPLDARLRAIADGYIEAPRATVVLPQEDASPGVARWHAQHPNEKFVEDRMRALAADMDRDAPLTAEILRQFADEVTHLRAAGDRAIQSIVSRLPEATDPTPLEGQ